MKFIVRFSNIGDMEESVKEGVVLDHPVLTR